MNVAPRPQLAGLSLFAGIGMLDEGARAGFDLLGFDYRCVGYVERDAYAAATLVARMESAALDQAPIWDDIETFDGEHWRGLVDCVVAGFPCQDISVAGRRAGLDGARSGLFYEVLRVAADCAAPLLFLENVAGIASATASVMDEADGFVFERACARIMGELADRGWDAEWLHLRASDVGATHRRERWFCLAWQRVADAEQCRPKNQPGLSAQGRQSDSGRCRFALADPARFSGGQRAGRERVLDRDPKLGLADCTDSERGGEDRDEEGRTEPNGYAGLAGRELFAPGPADPRWSGIIADAPYLAPATKPDVRLLVDGVAYLVDESRQDQLRLCGNGVVPAQAAAALVELVRRMTL